MTIHHIAAFWSFPTMSFEVLVYKATLQNAGSTSASYVLRDTYSRLYLAVALCWFSYVNRYVFVQCDLLYCLLSWYVWSTVIFLLPVIHCMLLFSLE